MHELAVEVGVTRYCTVPVVVLLGLVSVWSMMFPDPALAPVMPPVIVPIIQVKVLGMEAVKIIFDSVPLQVVAVAEVVTAGAGLTVTVMV